MSVFTEHLTLANTKENFKGETVVQWLSKVLSGLEQ